MSTIGGMEWAAFGAVILVLIALGGVQAKAIDRINKAEGKADGAEKIAQNAAISIAANKLEIERVESDLVLHRVETAKEYVSKNTLESLENKVIDAINRLGDRLDKMLQAR